MDKLILYTETIETFLLKVSVHTAYTIFSQSLGVLSKTKEEKLLRMPFSHIRLSVIRYRNCGNLIFVTPLAMSLLYTHLYHNHGNQLTTETRKTLTSVTHSFTPIVFYFSF